MGQRRSGAPLFYDNTGPQVVSVCRRALSPVPALARNCYRICYPTAHNETKRDHIEGAGQGAISARFIDTTARNQMRPNRKLHISRPVP